MITDQSFGAWLKQRRRDLDLTQEALAEQAGCSAQMIRRVEAGTARPSRQLAELLAVSLQVPAAERAEYVQWARLGQRTPQTAAPHETPHAEENAPVPNPYKGLRAFQESDAADFFGREALTGRLVSRLAEPTRLGRFLTVVGPSGSGKSSVVRAGLVPALRQGAVPQFLQWPVLDIMPGAHPFEEIEAALLRVAVNPPSSLMPQLKEDERGLLRAVKRALPGQQHGLVLVLDQFEEIFTLVEDEEMRRHFLDSLYASAADPNSPLVVVATLRADFYDRPLGYRQAGELLRDRAEVVLPMSAEELEKAIVLPAAQLGVGLETDLLAAVVQDTVMQPGALPLLQYALTELFELREGRLMTLRAYRASGGVHGALSRRAESLYAQLNDVEQEEARQMFLRLVMLGEGVEDTRRRARRAEIAGAARDEQALERVLELFGRHRLLTFDRDPVLQTPTVEVAHEALLQSWPRLRGWLDANRESLRTHRRLISATSEWVAAGNDTSFLAHGVRLAQFRDLGLEGHVALNDQEQQYLRASQEAEAQAEANREAQRQSELQAAHQLAETQQRAANQLRRRAIFLSGTLLLVLLMAGIAIYFGSQARTLAGNEQAARLKAEQEGRLATSRELAAAALNNLNIDPERSILLSLQAVKTTYDVDKTWTKESENALHTSVLASHALLSVQAQSALIGGVAFSPDGKLLAVCGLDSTVKVLDAATGKQLFALPALSSTAPPDSGVQSVAFSPDGKLLATGSDDAQVRLWDPQTGRLVRTLSGHQDAVTTVTFSPDGTRLGSSSADDTARVWDVATGNQLLTIQAKMQGVLTISFSPDNKRVATGDFHTKVKIWDGTSGQLLLTIDDAWGLLSPDGTKIATAAPNIWDAVTGKKLTGLCCHTNVLSDVTWSADSTRVATVSRDRTARIWDAATGKELRTLWGHAAPLNAVAFSRDGTRLVTGDVLGVVKVWDLGPDRELMVSPVTGFSKPAMRVVGFSADGKRIIAGFGYGASPQNGGSQVRLLDAGTGSVLLTIPMSFGIWDVALSPDGKTIVTGGDGDSTKVWDAASGRELYPFRAPSDSTKGVAFSPDSKRFATADKDHAARVWDTATGKLLLTLKGHMDELWGVAFSPNGKRLVTTSLDRTARVWDLSTGQSVMTLTGHTDAVYGVAYSPDGTHIATAGRDGTGKIWDAATGKELVTLKGHTSTLTHVAFSPDGKRVVTASTDKTAKVWDVATGEELLSLPGVWSAAFSPDGTRLVTPDSDDNTIKVYALRVEDLVALAKARLTRTWTPDECRTFLHADRCPAP